MKTGALFGAKYKVGVKEKTVFGKSEEATGGESKAVNFFGKTKKEESKASNLFDSAAKPEIKKSEKPTPTETKIKTNLFPQKKTEEKEAKPEVKEVKKPKEEAKEEAKSSKAAVKPSSKPDSQSTPSQSKTVFKNEKQDSLLKPDFDEMQIQLDKHKSEISDLEDSDYPELEEAKDPIFGPFLNVQSKIARKVMKILKTLRR